MENILAIILTGSLILLSIKVLQWLALRHKVQPPTEYLTIVVDGKRYGYLAHSIELVLPQIADWFAGGKLTEVTVEKMAEGLWCLNPERSLEVRLKLDNLWKSYAQGAIGCQPAS